MSRVVTVLILAVIFVCGSQVTAIAQSHSTNLAVKPIGWESLPMGNVYLERVWTAPIPGSAANQGHWDTWGYADCVYIDGWPPCYTGWISSFGGQ